LNELLCSFFSHRGRQPIVFARWEQELTGAKNRPQDKSQYEGEQIYSFPKETTRRATILRHTRQGKRLHVSLQDEK
jgi:hypothetical protein